jgi:hypothetical protein
MLLIYIAIAAGAWLGIVALVAAVCICCARADRDHASVVRG